MDSYHELTDEQLIQRLRAGDEGVMDFILDKYKPLVRKKANAMYLIGGETDDLIQEGMIGLFKAIRDFNEEKEASFYQFAQLCITRQLYRVIEASNRKKQVPLNTYVSFYEKADDGSTPLADTLSSGKISDPEQLFIDQETEKTLLEELRGRLSKMENQVLDYYLSGFNYKQIAQKMQKSPKAIDNALQRIRAKMR